MVNIEQNNTGSTITISNNDYGEISGYSINVVTDISRRSVTFPGVINIENERYIQFIFAHTTNEVDEDVSNNVIFIGNGLSKIFIKGDDVEVYNNILSVDFDEDDKLRYDPKTKGRFVYKKQ